MSCPVDKSNVCLITTIIYTYYKELQEPAVSYLVQHCSYRKTVEPRILRIVIDYRFYLCHFGGDRNFSTSEGNNTV